jgi:hypothetical protein
MSDPRAEARKAVIGAYEDFVYKFTHWQHGFADFDTLREPWAVLSTEMQTAFIIDDPETRPKMIGTVWVQANIGGPTWVDMRRMGIAEAEAWVVQSPNTRRVKP